MKGPFPEKNVALALGILCITSLGCPAQLTHPQQPDVVHGDSSRAADTHSTDVVPVDTPSRLDAQDLDSFLKDTPLVDSDELDSIEDATSATCQSFESAVQPIFDQHCVGCHNPFSREPKLDLSTGNAMSALVLVSSTVDANLTFVVPGNAAESYLIDKLGPAPAHGMPMPIIGPAAGPGLDPDEVSVIAAWIDAGATDEPFLCSGEDAGVDTSVTDTEEPDVENDVADEGPSDAADDVAEDSGFGA